VRVASLRSPIGLRVPLVLLSVGVVFLGCFALARVLRAHATAGGESTSLPVEAASVAPPLRMGSAPAIESALARPVRPAPKLRATTQPRFAAPAPALGGETSHSEEAQAPPASPAPAAPVAERAPAPAPPARSSPPSGGGSHSSSGGGSFESSG